MTVKTGTRKEAGSSKLVLNSKKGSEKQEEKKSLSLELKSLRFIAEHLSRLR